mmetsp:Transcript_15535/g.33576  ORF Transcript_15535/g.33576 Transcript_15535/m.33576 type:complete len:649 (-) Transcript_15535:1412-3358(-)
MMRILSASLSGATGRSTGSRCSFGTLPRDASSLVLVSSVASRRTHSSTRFAMMAAAAASSVLSGATMQGTSVSAFQPTSIGSTRSFVGGRAPVVNRRLSCSSRYGELLRRLSGTSSCVKTHPFVAFTPEKHFTTATTAQQESTHEYPGIQTDEERQMTKDALQIISAAIESVNPTTAIENCVLKDPAGFVLKDPTLSSRTITYHRSDYDEVLIVSFGKASSAMALTTADIVRTAMPNVTLSGIAVVKDDHATDEEATLLPTRYNITIREASHPIPDSRSIEAASEILDRVEAAGERTLVVCCISGGGSALFCAPRHPLILSDIAETNRCLLSSGMSIDNMNVIRKRLELGKGGRLAAAAYPATVVALVLSDIVGDPLDLIASGPTVPDPSSWDDAVKLVGNYGLGRGGEYELPSAVLDVLDSGVKGELEGTPGDEHPAFSTKRSLEDSSMLTGTVLIGNNELAVTSAATEAERSGYNAIMLGSTVEGEARDVAGVYTSLAEQLSKQRTSPGQTFALAKLPAALIAGGETTVTLGPSSGKGGRNQEIGLVAALHLKNKGLRDIVVASAGTDGTDGPTDAAGAVVDGGTIDRVEHMNGGTVKGVEALEKHDAYTFFDSVGSTGESTSIYPLIRTGPTGTNVADVCVVLVK